MNKCAYCQDPDRYGLLPASVFVYGEDSIGTNYWTSGEILKLNGQKHLGHGLKVKIPSYPNFNVICQNEDKTQNR